MKIIDYVTGLDSEFALFETALVSIYDALPRLRSKKPLVSKKKISL